MPISANSFVRSQLLFIAVGLLALVGIVGVAIWLGERSEQLANEIIAARDLKTASVELGALVQRAESSQRGFLYTSNEVYLAPYDLAKTSALRQVADLPARVAPYAQLAPVVERLDQLVRDKFAEMDEGIDLTRNRDRDGALDLMLTNRGKALMDEASVYVTGISLAADQRLEGLVAEQTANTLWQRLVTVVGALVAIAAASAALITIFRYASELASARDSLAAANGQLETRVADRTAELARSNSEMKAAKERAELLVHEVNHRVANSLAMVSSLVGLQANALGDARTKAVLAETQSRIQAISLVHHRLYASADVTEVELDVYLRSLLDQFQAAMGDANRITLRYQLDPILLKTDASINLGVIAAEWVMNAAKYAYPDRPGEVRVTLAKAGPNDAVLAVEDDGVGRGDGPAKGTGLGSRIVKAMATTMKGSIDYVDRQPGLLARLAFPLEAA